jgi:hypothetical protein
MTSTIYSEMTALCIRSIDLMTEGSREDFEPVYHPEAVNREAAVEPPACRQPGPAGFWATAQWLRAAVSGMRFEIHEAVEPGWVPPSPGFLLRAAIAKRRTQQHPA